jgi:hypothetical protein
MSWASRLRALLLVGVSTALTGCPLMLDDDFKTSPAESAGTNGEGGKGGGNGATGGTENVPDAGEAATAAAGGQNPSGGSPAVAGNAGTGAVAGDATAGGDGGAGGAANQDTCPPCSDDEECCEGKCVDLTSDPLNCRECGMGCPGTTCDNSSCTNTCVFGSIDCNFNIVDGCEVNPAVDPQNCGNCDIECGFGYECVGGYCQCPTGTADCDSNKANGCEVDITSSAGNCNGCGKACDANEICENNACECAVGFADCNGLPEDGCEADLSATGTCGSCQLDCGPHSLCVAAGQCGCQTGFLECDAQALGCETPVTDPLNCGDCDIVCPVQTPVCDGTACVDGCNGLTRCGDSCVDTDTDPAHCGGCDQPVGQNQICVGGLPECLTGFDDCDSDPTDCEINTQTDVNHCGGCGGACKPGAYCNLGSCACSPATPNDCGASCAQCCDDGQCSDGDPCTADTCSGGVCGAGVQCESGGECCSGTGCFECCSDGDCDAIEVCSGNTCIQKTCTLPEILCGASCVNANTDANNCGGCGNKCGKGRTCSGGSCTPKWVATAAPLAGFVNREKAAYAAMGSKVFVWGGNDQSGNELNTGAIYDPDTDTWTAVGTGGSPPSARILATAVWTGSVMVVWGGGDENEDNDYNTGGRYDPVTNTWSTMSTVGALTARRAVYGYWTGSRVLFYSGFDRNGTPLSGASLYDPVNDTWTAGTLTGRPAGRLDATNSWSGTFLTVSAGRINSTYYGDAHTYEVAVDDWDSYATGGPSTRWGAFGGWDGSYHVVWSGANGNTYRTDGKLFDPATGVWTNMLAVGQPVARRAPHRETGWSARIKPRVTLMVGGYDSNAYRRDGGIYNSLTNAWSSVAAWPSANSHLWGVGVWTGTEFVVWGGRSGTGNSLTNVGERFVP